MHFKRLNIKLHKYLSLLVGVQVIIWVGTGIYFNLMDKSSTSGNEYREFTKEPNKSFLGDEKVIFTLSELPVAQAEQVKLISILGKRYYQVVLNGNAHSYQVQTSKLFDAVSGQPFVLDNNTVKAIALRSYNGHGSVVDVELLSPPIAELAKQENTVWRIKINDRNKTNIYVDNSTGRVIAHVNNDRRIRDLMFKLHFMDYFNTGGFNNWLILIFAVLTLLFSVTGIIWLYQLFLKKGLFASEKKAQRRFRKT